MSVVRIKNSDKLYDLNFVGDDNVGVNAFVKGCSVVSAKLFDAPSVIRVVSEFGLDMLDMNDSLRSVGDIEFVPTSLSGSDGF